MKFEFSAGGIVYKKEADQIVILVVQHGKHHHWSFPKGHIGDTIKGETKEQAALREVKEETGITADILKPLSPQIYWYQMDGERRKKTVYYFVMRYVKGDTSHHDFEMENVEWLHEELVEDRLTFPADKKTWSEAIEEIHKL